jgi:hypothetical protein
MDEFFRSLIADEPESETSNHHHKGNSNRSSNKTKTKKNKGREDFSAATTSPNTNMSHNNNNTNTGMLSDGEDDDSYGPAPPPPSRPHPDDTDFFIPPAPPVAAAAAAVPTTTDHRHAGGGGGGGTFGFLSSLRRDVSPEGEKFRDDYDYDSNTAASPNSSVNQSGNSSSSHRAFGESLNKGDDPPQEQPMVGDDYLSDHDHNNNAHQNTEYEEEEYSQSYYGGEEGEDGETVEIPPTTVVQRMLAEDEVDKTESNRCLYLAALVACCIIIAGVILGVGFGTGAFTKESAISSNGNGGGSAGTGDSSSRGVDPTVPTANGTHGGDGTTDETPLTPEQSAAITSHLTSISVAGVAAFNETDSASSLALSELLRQDSLILDPAMPADAFRLSQRFALLSLWYSSFDAWFNETGWTEPIHECEWHGVMCETLPVDGVTEEQQVVVAIDLNRNNLQGSIPADITLLTELAELNLGDNKITSPLPKALWQMNKLKRLFLNNNNLEEELPADFSGMSSLLHFDAANNELSGDLSIFWTMPTDQMEFLVLDYNQFSGTLDGVSALQALSTY